MVEMTVDEVEQICIAHRRKYGLICNNVWTVGICQNCKGEITCPLNPINYKEVEKMEINLPIPELKVLINFIRTYEYLEKRNPLTLKSALSILESTEIKYRK